MHYTTTGLPSPGPRSWGELIYAIFIFLFLFLFAWLYKGSRVTDGLIHHRRQLTGLVEGTERAGAICIDEKRLHREGALLR